MKITLSYQEALAKHPEAVAQVLAKQASSRGKLRNTAPEQLPWSYSHSLVVQGRAFSLTDLQAGVGIKRPELTAAERLGERLANISACLCVESGRTYWSASHFSVIPEEIVDLYRRDFAKEEAETARFNALPLQERQAETNRLLTSLGASPSFVALKVAKTT